MRVNNVNLHTSINILSHIHCMCKHKNVFTLLCKLNITLYGIFSQLIIEIPKDVIKIYII